MPPQVTQRPLFAYVARHNVGSIRVLEKCGFELAGKAARLRTKATSRRSS
jgi:RimJ/RimL family protein N-acetyltransferase